jgi:7,8-dihydropterin-6-yl-methyl-4-(beta-D-ribofuranosyl)aminobenzene 5'-phosphate synthase
MSGKIPHSTAFQHGLSGQHRRRGDGDWEPDPLIMDERGVAANVKGKGLIVFTTCSHAGYSMSSSMLKTAFPVCR